MATSQLRSMIWEHDRVHETQCRQRVLRKWSRRRVSEGRERGEDA